MGLLSPIKMIFALKPNQLSPYARAMPLLRSFPLLSTVTVVQLYQSVVLVDHSGTETVSCCARCSHIRYDSWKTTIG
jgi:hypothetical protein